MADGLDAWTEALDALLPDVPSPLDADGGHQEDVAETRPDGPADVRLPPVADGGPPPDEGHPGADGGGDAPRCECATGPCCDGCRFQATTHECIVQEYGCPAGTGCGSPVAVRTARRVCSGAGAECDGELMAAGEWQEVSACQEDESCVEGAPACVPSPACPCPEGMVHVPAGSFPMGARPGEGNDGDEYPQHTVAVPAYCIDQYEVTAAEYAGFLNAVWPDQPCQFGLHGHCVDWDWEFPEDNEPITPPPLSPGASAWVVEDHCQAEPGAEPVTSCAEHPMTVVTWDGARQYCLWRDRRLPTEAEWERAAKGPTERRYPWGDEPPGPGVANCGWDLCVDGFRETAPVGSFPRDLSPAGCFDVAGNVDEWVEDDYHFGYEGAPVEGSAWVDEPRRILKVVRGGAFLGGEVHVRTTHRASGSFGLHFGGFRCAWSPAAESAAPPGP